MNPEPTTNDRVLATVWVVAALLVLVALAIAVHQ